MLFVAHIQGSEALPLDATSMGEALDEVAAIVAGIDDGDERVDSVEIVTLDEHNRRAGAFARAFGTCIEEGVDG